ncbi:hypothetical protein [Celeribacter sp. SCSIO 80788]|uniref:hypothetical protein n=1 Tax=Celeribacter sp. SCSIO 80788 TaxID=3117013 RepID=UPI003DA4ECD3
MRRFALLLASLLLPTGAYADTPDCEALYAKAETACRATQHTCNMVKICNNMIGACPQPPATDAASCGAFDACTSQNTPRIFKYACRYDWSEGACRSANSPDDEALEACPAASATSGQSCARPRLAYQQAAEACETAAIAYARTLTCLRPVSDLYVRKCDVPDL